MYDIPHIFKCIRNNLLTKDLEINVGQKGKNVERKFVSWKHVITAYEIDLYGPRKERRLNKITDAHIYKKDIKKMSVIHMAQVFSSTFANEIEDQAKKKGIYIQVSFL